MYTILELKLLVSENLRGGSGNLQGEKKGGGD